MIYSNPEFFLLFFPTLFFYLVARSYRARFYCLLIASLAFYTWAGVQDAVVFLFVIGSSWLAVYAASRFPSRRRGLVACGIAIMAVHLFFWKYAAWITAQIQIFYPDFLHGQRLDLPLPVGISFFTLQGIAYLVDYGKKKTGLIGFREYLLFKSFFPQLVAGPIVRAHQLMPQLRKLHTPSASDLATGISLFSLGFAKKLLIADRLAILVDPIFSSPGTYNRWSGLVGIVGYAMQIWADFSGYTDMGRGCAKCLGIDLPENFLSPYLAQNPSEFWKRWHITLSQWIRDYLYIPLGGNRGSQLRVAVVTLTTMGIAGLWHGANWTFVIWGLYHGSLLIFHRAVKDRLAWLGGTNPAKVILRWATMQSFVLFGWLIFRAQSMATVAQYLRSLVENKGIESAANFTSAYSLILLGMAVQGLGYKVLEKNQFPFFEWVKRQWRENVTTRSSALTYASAASLGTLLALVIVVSLVARVSTESQPFIYFQF